MRLLILGFLLVALLLVGGLHRYLWLRLVRAATARGSAGRRVGTVAAVALPLLTVVAMLGGRALPLSISRVLVWPGYLWIAVMFYLVLVLLVAELPAHLARRTLTRRPAPAGVAVAEPPATGAGAVAVAVAVAVAGTGGATGEVDAGRRLLLARSVAVAAGLIALTTVGAGTVTALGPPVHRRVRIPLAKLPRRYDGLRIAVVSDIHLGPILGRGHTQRIVDIINDHNADLVTVVGDLVDGTVADLGAAADPLAGLRSRLGAYFVTGNHEYFSGFEPWIEKVSSLGLRVLRNELVALDAINLAGVNDITGGSYGDAPDYDKALADRDPSRPVVLLAHQPVQAAEAARRGVDLQLSGHTHGGQMWPFSLAVAAQQPLVAASAESMACPST
jgi:predicted MPP superfamily phosphohydrolase